MSSAAKKKTLRFAMGYGALLLLALPLAVPSRAAEDSCETLMARVARKIVSRNVFTTDRDLYQYLSRFSKRLTTDLAALGPKDTWLDMGSGKAFAQESFLTGKMRTLPRTVGVDEAEAETIPRDIEKALALFRERDRADKPKVLAVTKVLGRKIPKGLEGDLRVLSGRFVEDIPASELGRAKLITDFYGPFAYTNRPDLVLAKYLQALADGGAIHMMFSSRMLLNKVKTPKGEKTLLQWLKAVPGIKVEVLSNKDHALATARNSTIPEMKSIRITRSGEPLEIPVLHMTEIYDKAPPIRYFEQKN